MKIITFVTILWQKYLRLKAACHQFKRPVSLSYSVPVWCHFASLLPPPFHVTACKDWGSPPECHSEGLAPIHCTESRAIWPAPTHSSARRSQWLWWLLNSASWTNLTSWTNSTRMARWGKRDWVRIFLLEKLDVFIQFLSQFWMKFTVTAIVGMLGSHIYRFSIVIDSKRAPPLLYWERSKKFWASILGNYKTSC